MSNYFQFNSINRLNDQIKDELMLSHPSRTIQLSVGQTIKKKICFHEEIYPSNELSDSEINGLLERWMIAMRYHRILLVFNDAEESRRARYDFISTVILEMELPPHPPEMHFCFVYDSVADNLLAGSPDQLMQSVLAPILNKEKITHFQFINKRVKLNTFDNLSEPELHYLIGRYQQRYTSISSLSVSFVDKKLVNNRVLFRGRHETGYCFDSHCQIVRGLWELELAYYNEAWKVVSIQIEGVEF